MGPQSADSKRKIIATLAVLIVIVAIVAGATLSDKKKSTDDTANTGSTNTSQKTNDGDTYSRGTGDDISNDTAANDGGTNTGDTSTANSSSYKDGTYSASGSYDSPGGTERITINATLQNGVVTATSAKAGATNPEAQEYQEDFISGYSQLIVGKSIDSIRLSRVSGSSLTSQGFNSAIAKIKSQAQSAT